MVSRLTTIGPKNTGYQLSTNKSIIAIIQHNERPNTQCNGT